LGSPRRAGAEVRDLPERGRRAVAERRGDAFLRSERPTVDFPALLELLKKYRLAPVAVRGRGEQAAAMAAGLFPAPDARIGTARCYVCFRPSVGRNMQKNFRKADTESR
jgi:uncharacterized membrane protein